MAARFWLLARLEPVLPSIHSDAVYVCQGVCAKPVMAPGLASNTSECFVYLNSTLNESKTLTPQHCCAARLHSLPRSLS